MTEEIQPAAADPVSLSPVSRIIGINNLLWTSLMPRDRNQAVLIARSLNGPAEELVNHTGEVIPVQHLLVQQRQSVNEETGEEETWTHTALITTDGRVFTTGSRSVARDIGSLVEIFGNPPWSPPVWLTCESGPARGKGKYYKLLMAEMPTATDGPAARKAGK